MDKEELEEVFPQLYPLSPFCIMPTALNIHLISKSFFVEGTAEEAFGTSKEAVIFRKSESTKKKKKNYIHISS